MTDPREPSGPDAAMDAELRAAGARWRNAQPAPTQATPAPADFDVRTEPAKQAPRRRLAMLLTAAVVAGFLSVVGWLAFGHHPDGGTTQASGASSQLDGYHWDVKLTPPFFTYGIPPYISFHDGQVVGSDSCNTFSGPADIGSSTITFGEIAITAMGCATPGTAGSTALPQRIDDLVSGTVSWSLSGDVLTLTSPTGDSLQFQRAKPADSASPTTPIDPQALTGRWVLQQTEETNANSGSGSASAGGFDSYLTITATGFSTDEPCYSTAGSLSIGTSTLDFGAAHDTRTVPCTSSSSQDEQSYAPLVDKTLDGTVQAVLSGGQLVLTKGGDALTYIRVPAGSSTAPDLPSGS